MIGRIQQYSKRVYDRMILGMPERHVNPYATHLPVLVHLSRLFRIRRVLELGAGLHSTPLFLNRSVFPDVEELVSCEDDAEWSERVRQSVNGDSRLRMVSVTGQVSQAVHDLEVDDFDLVFVDDSTRAEQRLDTIRTVAEQTPQNAVVALHDVEYEPYRKALQQGFRHMYRFCSVNPNVGVAWNRSQLDPMRLRDLDRRIRATARRTQIDDVAKWVDDAGSSQELPASDRDAA